LKILLASSSSGSRGGGELCLLYLGRALRERGHDVSLWVAEHPRMNELASAFLEIGPVIRADYTNTYDRTARSLASFADLATAMRVARQWRGIAPDVIHLNKQCLEDGLDLVNAARRSRLPALTMIHITQRAAYLGANHAGLRDCVSRIALRRFRGLIATTPESRRRDLAAFLGENPRLRVVPNGVPIFGDAKLAGWRDATRRAIGIAPGELLCVGVGRMVPQKRPLLFLEMAERIHRQIPEARFRWVGDGSVTAEWDAWVAERKLGDVIRRLPWQNEVPRFLSAANVFMHTAEFEGLAFAILEALAAGLPCAITPNLLADMPFLNAQNSIAIGDDGSWIEALRDRAKLCAIGKAARQLAEKEFSFTRMAAEYETLYGECVAMAR
jgi:glycosyltransferase involved in cell wall biosynthesis